MKDRLIQWIPPIAAAFIRLLYASLRVRHVHLEGIERLNQSDRPYILAFWHGHLLLMCYARFRRPLRAMISQHRDGEIIARTLARFDVDSARGSTTRGGISAMRELMRTVAAGERIAFTPDGPRGPRRIAQPGVIAAARLTGAPIVPVAVIAKKKSSFAPGIGSRFPSPSRVPCTSTEIRSRFHARSAIRRRRRCVGISSSG